MSSAFRRSPVMCAAALVLLGACAGDAAAPAPFVPEGPRVALPPATGEPLVLGDAELLAEAADGRVWTPRFGEGRLVRLDFAARRADTMRAGDEFDPLRLPFWIATGPAGTQLVLDAAGARVAAIDTLGRVVGQLDVPDGAAIARLRTDTLGGFAWTEPADDEDHVTLVRRAPGQSMTDTLATLLVPRATVNIPAGDRAITMAPEGAPRDLWGMLPDGTVWVATAADHQLTYHRADGTRVIGGPRAFTPVASTDADRGLLRGLPAPAAVSVDAIRYAPVKGPFLEARAFDDGEVWTWLTQPAPKAAEYYAVFRPGVAETVVVELPLHHRVVGTGRTHVYVGRLDADGRWRVTRHQRPALP